MSNNKRTHIMWDANRNLTPKYIRMSNSVTNKERTVDPNKQQSPGWPQYSNRFKRAKKPRITNNNQNLTKLKPNWAENPARLFATNRSESCERSQPTNWSYFCRQYAINRVESYGRADVTNWLKKLLSYWVHDWVGLSWYSDDKWAVANEETNRIRDIDRACIWGHPSYEIRVWE